MGKAPRPRRAPAARGRGAAVLQKRRRGGPSSSDSDDEADGSGGGAGAGEDGDGDDTADGADGAGGSSAGPLSAAVGPGLLLAAATLAARTVALQAAAPIGAGKRGSSGRIELKRLGVSMPLDIMRNGGNGDCGFVAVAQGVQGIARFCGDSFGSTTAWRMLCARAGYPDASTASPELLVPWLRAAAAMEMQAHTSLATAAYVEEGMECGMVSASAVTGAVDSSVLTAFCANMGDAHKRLWATTAVLAALCVVADIEIFVLSRTSTMMKEASHVQSMRSHLPRDIGARPPTMPAIFLLCTGRVHFEWCQPAAADARSAASAKISDFC